MKSRFLIYITLLVVISTFYGCYNDFLVINSEFSSPVKPDTNTVIFFHTIKASQPPKGISRFPDGGTHKIIYKNTSIYKYDIGKNSLNKIYDFGNLPFNSWNTYISVLNDKITYSIAPSLGWEWRKYNSTRKEEFASLNTKIGGIYLYDLNTSENKKIIKYGCHPEFSPDGNKILYLTKDTTNIQIMIYNISNNTSKELFETTLTSSLSHHFWLNEKEIYLEINNQNYLIDINENIADTSNLSNHYQNSYSFKVKELKNLLKAISISEWGFTLKEYWNKDIDDLCDDIVLLNGNLAYRKAILEEFNDDLSKKDIERILKRIEERKLKLDGYEKTQYEIFSQETIDLLNQYLARK